jgi:hypothetical protein
VATLLTPFLTAGSTEQTLKKNVVLVRRGQLDDQGKPWIEDGTVCKRDTEDFIQQGDAPEADDMIVVEGDRLTEERLNCVLVHTLEHPESGHNVPVVGPFHTQLLVAYSLMLIPEDNGNREDR